MLISEELMNLKTIISECKIQNEAQQSVLLINSNQEIQMNIQIEGKIKMDEINGNTVINQTGQKFKFCSNENYNTYLEFMIKVVKLQQLKLKEEQQLLKNLLEELGLFSSKFDQIQSYKQETQIKFLERFQFRFSEFIRNLEQQKLAQADFQQQEDENFKLYFERIQTNLSRLINDQEITQTQITLPYFLYQLKIYIQSKLLEKRCISKTTIDQESLIQKITKLCFWGKEEVEDEEESNLHQGLFDSLIQKYKDFKNNDEWKIKQGLVLTIIQISSNGYTDKINQFCQKALVQLWISEKDQRVRHLLKNQDLIRMQMKILQKDWQAQTDGIAREMQQMLVRIDELQEQISCEFNINKRDQQLKEMDQTTQELDEYIENISEMGQQLRLVTDFVNHLRKGLIRVEGKINEMKKQLNSIGNDIKFLRGKSVAQLFEIRKWKVLKEAAYKIVKSIYVPLQTVEIFHKAEKVEKKALLNNEQRYKVDEDYHAEQDDENQNDEEKEQDLFQNEEKWEKKDKPSILINLEQLNDRQAEVNEFLQDEKETVLLIHGVAGSGKSTTAKKIEEFIWKLHNVNQKIGNHVLIPVYISLPSLKNPVFQAVEEALHQDEYGFDDLQLNECKEILEKKEFRFLLIMDGYDEMKRENIQKNLYLNNKLKQNWFDPPVIFTTRSEIFTSNNYALWFEPEGKDKLKEIQLQKFDSKQMMEYLKKYTIQSVKMLIFELYEWQTTISNRGAIDINRFLICWNQIHQVTQFNVENLLNQKSIDHILSFLKKDEFLALKNPDTLRNLSLHLHKLWSVKKYENMMAQINLHQLVETPYMMEIIVQVLPGMMVKATEVIALKQNFKKNFPNMLKQCYKSKYLIRMYQQQQQKYLITQSNKNEQESLKFNNEEVRSSDVENLEKINYHQIASEFWTKLEENSIPVQFQNSQDVNDLNTKLLKLFEQKLVLSNNALVKVEIQKESIIEVVCDALTSYDLTSYDFYDEFINQYHLKQIEKQRNLGKSINIDRFLHDLKQYSIKLAQTLSLKQVTLVQYKSQGLLYKDEKEEEKWLNEFFNDDGQYGSYKKDIRSCSLVQQKGANFSFVHKSIQEFLVAAELFGMLVLPEDLDAQIFSSIIETLSKNNIQDQDCLKFLFTQKNFEFYGKVDNLSLFEKKQKINVLKKNIEEIRNRLKNLKFS